MLVCAETEAIQQARGGMAVCRCACCVPALLAPFGDHLMLCKTLLSEQCTPH